MKWGVEAGHQMVQSAAQHDMETIMNASLLFLDSIHLSSTYNNIALPHLSRRFLNDRIPNVVLDNTCP